MYQVDKSTLGVIGFSFVMTPFFMNEISFLILFKTDSPGADVNASALSLQQRRSASESIFEPILFSSCTQNFLRTNPMEPSKLQVALQNLRT
jgi:hypothetical protein